MNQVATLQKRVLATTAEPAVRATALPRPRRLRGRHGRDGNAVIEMAIVLPLLTVLGMGMAEFGQFFYVRHAFESAARDSMRFAIPGSAKQGDPAAAATATLAQAGITFNPSWMTIVDCANYGTTVTDVSTVPAGHALTVSMSATYATLPNAYRPLSSFCGVGIGSGKVIACKCTMVKE